MTELIRTTSPQPELPAPYHPPRLTARGHLIRIRQWLVPQWLVNLKMRMDAWQFARRMNHDTLVLMPQDSAIRRAVQTAIERGDTIGLQVKAYRAMYDPKWVSRSCNIFAIGDHQILAPTLFAVLGLDPLVMQTIYFDWQKPSTPNPTDEEIMAWRKRRMQAFTDILPFACIRWYRRDPYEGSDLLGEYTRGHPELALTLEQALAECGPQAAPTPFT